MANKLKISVIIPLFNAELFIAKCIDSLILQTYKDIEIIVVNDGSTDGSLNILQRYTNSHSNIIVLTKENEGPGVARNYGLDICTGDIVMFLDADDYYSENCCELVAKYMNDGRPDFICFGAKFISGENKIIKEISYDYKELSDRDILDNFYSVGDIKSVAWNKAYKTSMLNIFSIRFPRNRINEDAMFTMAVAFYAKTVKFVPAVMYCHTSSNPLSFSNTITTEHFSSSVEVLNAEKKLLCDKGVYDSFELPYFIHSAKLLTHLLFLGAYSISYYSIYSNCNSIIYRSNIWRHLLKVKVREFPLVVSLRILLCRQRWLLWVTVKSIKVILKLLKN